MLPTQRMIASQPAAPKTAKNQADVPSNTEALTRALNTAMVAVRSAPLSVEVGTDFSAALFELMKAPAFNVLLAAVERHAQEQSLPAPAAAEDLIRTFRRLDDLWQGYVLREGVARICSGS